MSKKTIFNWPVHPAAAIFPMLSDEELDDLAADIKANGLLHAIVVQDEQIIDGRNRLEACKRAGIEPRTEELTGSDPAAFILSANINRRHLSKGQRAMAIAKLYPESQTGPGKRSKTAVLLETKSISGAAVSQARLVLRQLPELADAVLAGTTPLASAYEQAQQIKEASASDAARLDRLRERASDFADLVDEGRMSLAEAEAAYHTRQEDERRSRQATLEVLKGLEQMLDVLSPGPRLKDIVKYLEARDRSRMKSVAKQWSKNIDTLIEELK